MSGLVMVGLSHHAAPLEVRERVALDETRWREVAPTDIATVLVSTCNRVEIYAWAAERPAALARRLHRALARAANVSLPELQPYLLTGTGRLALVHLVRVAAGLDSLVIGEEQIRGQIRDALRAAETAGELPATLRGVFQRVSESARRIRGSTRLGQLPSLAAAGVHAASRLVAEGTLRDQLVVVFGAGVMARAAAEAVLPLGAHLLVINRTPAHAEALVNHLGARARSGALDEVPAALARASLAIGATASRRPVLDLATVQAALAQRERREPLVLLDIAMPRDIDPRARMLDGVCLVDMDDLERDCPLDVSVRRAELEHAEALAVEEADRLMHWLQVRAASPAIAALRTDAETIRLRELRRSAGRLKDLTPEQVAAVEALTAGIVSKLLHAPTVALRNAAVKGMVRPGIATSGPLNGRTA